MKRALGLERPCLSVGRQAALTTPFSLFAALVFPEQESRFRLFSNRLVLLILVYYQLAPLIPSVPPPDAEKVLLNVLTCDLIECKKALSYLCSRPRSLNDKSIVCD